MTTRADLGQMNANDQRAWWVVASLFVVLFFVLGSGYNTGGVFVGPLIKQFGWSRAQVSLLQTVLALSAGLFTMVVGWMLDRIDARIVISIGAAVAGAGFLVASRATGLGSILAAYGLLGVGIAMSTLLPASLVIPNWFGERRGVPLGIVMAGTSVGGMVMAFIGSRVIMSGGWRLAYLVLAAPMILAVIPLVVAFVRTRPAGARGTTSVGVERVPQGLELGRAVRGRSIWLIAVAQLLSGMAVTGMNLHLVPYLTGAGYAPGYAAGALSVVLGLGAIGKLGMGYAADRIGARASLALNLVLMAIAFGMLPLLSKGGALSMFVFLYGLTWGAPLVLYPIVLAEAVGLKRLGSLLGLTGLFTTIGSALGPVLAGRIFDSTGSYSGAFDLFAVGLLIAAAAAATCHRLSESEPLPAVVKSSGL
jgi:MFS family permease